MQDSEIHIREAGPDDAEMLLAWRNDPQTRAMSFETARVEPQAHQAWFDRTLSNPCRCLYIGEYQGEDIGVCRFDLDTATSQAEISINMNPDYRGRGLAATFLSESIQSYRRMHQVAILARTRAANLASQKAFKRAGFKQQTVEGDTVFLLLSSDSHGA